MSFLYPANEYLRPWKLSSLLVGIALLILGSIYTPAPDWDIPVSFIMASLTYLTAPCSVRTLVERKWQNLPYAIASTWISVDGCYAIYWHLKDPAALELMRSANAPASFTLYVACGLIWLYRGTLRELIASIRSIPIR